VICKNCNVSMEYKPKYGCDVCPNCGVCELSEDIHLIPYANPDTPQFIFSVPEGMKNKIVDFLKKYSITIMLRKNWYSIKVYRDEKKGDVYVELRTDEGDSWLFQLYKCIYWDKQIQLEVEDEGTVFLSLRYSENLCQVILRDMAKFDIAMEIYRQYGYPPSSPVSKEKSFSFHYMKGISIEEAINEDSPNYLIQMLTDHYVVLHKSNPYLIIESFVHDAVYEIMRNRIKMVLCKNTNASKKMTNR